MLVSVNILGNWFCNHSPLGVFPPLNLLLEYWTEHVVIVCQIYVPIYDILQGNSGFATDCLCGIGCRGLTTCLLYVGPLFGN